MLNAWLGMIYLFKPADAEKAVEYSQRAALLGASAAYGYVGIAQAVVGRPAEELECLEKPERIKKDPFVPMVLKPLLFLKSGLRHFQTSGKKYVPAYLRAWIHLG